MLTKTTNKQLTLKDLIKSALQDCESRATTCLRAAAFNRMQDCGWSDTRSNARWMQEHFKAIYRLEAIKQWATARAKRSNKGAA